MTDDPLTLLINESVKNMYHGVYQLQKAGKLSSTGAKKMIADSLPRIYKLELVFTEDGVVEIDHDNPEEVERIERNIERMNNQLKAEKLI